MTIIDVARELEKDGTKRFRRPGLDGDFLWHGAREVWVFDPIAYNSTLDLDDLLAIDWEEVKE